MDDGISNPNRWAVTSETITLAPGEFTGVLPVPYQIEAAPDREHVN